MTKLPFEEKEKTQIKLQRINKQLNDIIENIQTLYTLTNPEMPFEKSVLNEDHPLSKWTIQLLRRTLKDTQKVQKETQKLQRQVKVKKQRKNIKRTPRKHTDIDDLADLYMPMVKL